MKKKEYDLILTDFDRIEGFNENNWDGNIAVNIKNIEKGL
jgi:hypothetical protein